MSDTTEATDQHRTLKPADDAIRVLEHATDRMVRDFEHPYTAIIGAAVELFFDPETARDWEAETVATHAINLAIISLTKPSGMHYMTRTRDWWALADDDAKRQAIDIAKAICRR
tara:strand:- start:9608 stop:9949 length:342 start_codon:yes stop_codon:yes gene_type:complete